VRIFGTGQCWHESERTVVGAAQDTTRAYEELEEEYQDVGRSILIFGLHVHVGIKDKELAIKFLIRYVHGCRTCLLSPRIRLSGMDA